MTIIVLTYPFAHHGTNIVNLLLWYLHSSLTWNLLFMHSLKLLIYFYVYGCLSCMYVCVLCVRLVPKVGQERELDALGLELQT